MSGPGTIANQNKWRASFLFQRESIARTKVWKLGYAHKFVLYIKGI